MSQRLRLLAMAEATTYLVLLGALAWRTLGGGPDLSGATGPVHGLVFLAYVAVVLIERADRRWSAATTGAALGASIIPFGGYVVAHRLLDAPDHATATAPAPSPATGPPSVGGDHPTST